MSMFSQRHYVQVADTIGLTLRQIDQARDTAKRIYGSDGEDVTVQYSSAIAIHRLIDNLEVTFNDDNPRFDSERFNARIGLVRREGLQQ